jgi:opacity protein-like surface antigen
MRAKKLFVGLAVTGAAAIATFASTPDASAQEIQLTGPLAHAPAARHLRLYREGRLEIAPSFSATILDEYRRTMLVGARINYGVTDWLAIGVWGAFGAVGVNTSLTGQIDSHAPRDAGLVNQNVGPTGSFVNQVSQISYLAMPQLTAVPFRGKFALFQSIFADVDAYVFLGAGIVGTKERADCNGVVECAANHELQAHSHIAPTFGLGFNFYLNKWLGVGFEYRMVPFSWNRAGFDSRGLDATGKPSSSGKFPDGKVDDADSTYKFNSMMSIYLGFSFPQKPKITD